MSEAIATSADTTTLACAGAALSPPPPIVLPVWPVPPPLCDPAPVVPPPVGAPNVIVDGLAAIEGVRVNRPAGTFYVFPDVREVCNRLGLTSHGLALYLLEGADDNFGVACLGGECFGEAGRGFLRFSCAEPDEKIEKAIAFLPQAFGRGERVKAFLARRPELALKEMYQ